MARHAAWSVSAAALDVGALGLALLTAHAVACARGAGPPLQSALAPTCPGMIALPPATGVAAIGLICIVLLGLVPFLTLRTPRRWPCLAAAAGQVALQLMGFGLFLFWLPALLLTTVAAIV